MKIFFDTEFTGLTKDTELISIGLVTEKGSTFYAEITDYDQSKVNNWIKENVIDNLKFNNRDNFVKIDPVPLNKHANLNGMLEMKGKKREVSEILKIWLSNFDKVEWVSDVAHYDFVLLIDLLYQNALDMPYNYCASCHDINQDIASFFDIDDIKAFNKSREEILKNSEKIKGDKHNSLYDALVIKEIYNLINK